MQKGGVTSSLRSNRPAPHSADITAELKTQKIFTSRECKRPFPTAHTTTEIIGKHQKLVPTIGERLVHTGGTGRSLKTYAMYFGALGALICGESSNPLATFAMATDYPVVHVASWPAHFGPTSDMAEVSVLVAMSIAYQLKVFVISACSIVTDELIASYQLDSADADKLAQLKGVGASCIAGPRGGSWPGRWAPMMAFFTTTPTYRM